MITGVVAAAATFISMHIKVARPWSDAKSKPENMELLSEEILSQVKFLGQEYWKWQNMMN